MDRNHDELNKVELILKNYALELKAGNDTWKETKTKLSGSLLTPVTRKPSRKRFGKKRPPTSKIGRTTIKRESIEGLKIFRMRGTEDSTLTTKQIISDTFNPDGEIIEVYPKIDDTEKGFWFKARKRSPPNTSNNTATPIIFNKKSYGKFTESEVETRIKSCSLKSAPGLDKWKLKGGY